MRPIALLFALLVPAVLVAGCGGGHTVQSTTTGRSAVETTGSASQAHLLAAARRAVVAHHRFSVRILWTNDVPEAPPWITGAALQAIRTAARDRSRRGVRVRLLQERFRILSLRLDPSYTRATAIVSDRQTGALYEHGERMPRPVRMNERARVELRRVGRTMRFVVTRVELIR